MSAPTALEVLDHVRTALEQVVEPAYRKKITELVPTDITIIGVRVPAIRKIAQAWHQANKDTTPETALDLLAAAFKRRCREELLFATVIVSRLKKKLTAAHLVRIDPLIEHIADWEVCDQLSMNVIGEIVAADLGETARLEKWAKSKNPWRRRAAIASTTALNQKGRKHADPTLKICAHVMTEKDAGAKKAVGWALREATKSDPKAVYDFLMSWRDTAEQRILNEGSQKLSAAQRKSLLD